MMGRVLAPPQMLKPRAAYGHSVNLSSLRVYSDGQWERQISIPSPVESKPLNQSTKYSARLIRSRISVPVPNLTIFGCKNHGFGNFRCKIAIQ